MILFHLKMQLHGVLQSIYTFYSIWLLFLSSFRRNSIVQFCFANPIYSITFNSRHISERNQSLPKLYTKSFLHANFMSFFLISSKCCWQVSNGNLIKISFTKSNIPTKIPSSLNLLLFLVWFGLIFIDGILSVCMRTIQWGVWQIVQMKCSVCVRIWCGILYVIGVNSNHFRINKYRITQIQ